MRYRFSWFGTDFIYVCPVPVPFGNQGLKVVDFDRFSDIVKSPYTFPKGVFWETNLNDVLTFKLFKKKGLNRCVKSYHRALAGQL